MGWIEILAATFVAVGCVGELILIFQSPPREGDTLELFEKRKHFRERLFVCLVAIGVTIELIVLPFNLREWAQLTKQAKEAEQRAGEANDRAVEAAKEAEKAKLQTALVESNNWILRSNMLELAAQIQPRRITPLQRENFIKILNDPDNVCKTHIRVFVGKTDQETEHFAADFRQMLNEAGYGETNETVELIPNFTVRAKAGENPKLVPVFAVYSGRYDEPPRTNNSNPPTVGVWYPDSRLGITNRMFSYRASDASSMLMKGYPGQIVRGSGTLKATPPAEPNQILSGVCGILEYVGMDHGAILADKSLPPGEIAFFIPQKIY